MKNHQFGKRVVKCTLHGIIQKSERCQSNKSTDASDWCEKDINGSLFRNLFETLRIFSFRFKPQMRRESSNHDRDISRRI